MSDADPTIAGKRLLRERMRARLDGMNANERRDASIAACGRIEALPEFAAADAVLLYLPLPGELDCLSLLESAFAASRIVCVPHVDWVGRAMQPVRLRAPDAGDLIIDRHGVRMPRTIEPVAVERLGCVVVPGLAFDERCRRLGRGGGFYDRFLPRLAGAIPAIGLAFECQVVSQLPAAPHDAGVAMVATERRLISR